MLKDSLLSKRLLTLPLLEPLNDLLIVKNNGFLLFFAGGKTNKDLVTGAIIQIKTVLKIQSPHFICKGLNPKIDGLCRIFIWALKEENLTKNLDKLKESLEIFDLEIFSESKGIQLIKVN